MRALFTCVPGFGHFHPMVPLARALIEAGHPVAFATAERFCRRVVEPAGFPAFAAGLSPIVASERTSGLASVALLSEDDVWRFGAHMFAEVAAPPKVADLVRAVRAWEADLVVHDMTDFAAPVAAAASGLPAANHSFGALQPAEFWDLAAELAAPTWTAWGLQPEPLGGMFRSLYLDICPPSLQSPMIHRVPTARRLRPLPAGDRLGAGAVGLPAWLAGPPAVPRVYVTLGTVANHTAQVFETVIAALAGLPVEVVVTVGPDRDPAELGAQPPSVHVERYLPQSMVFPSCRLVICHAGSGTTLSALSCGLPLLLLPQEANQLSNAELVVAAGAGELLRPAELSAEAVRQAVIRLLDDPSPRAQARRLAAEIAAMPSPEEVVAELERLARDGRR